MLFNVCDLLSGPNLTEQLQCRFNDRCCNLSAWHVFVTEYRWGLAAPLSFNVLKGASNALAVPLDLAQIKLDQTTFLTLWRFERGLTLPPVFNFYCGSVKSSRFKENQRRGPDKFDAVWDLTLETTWEMPLSLFGHCIYIYIYNKRVEHYGISCAVSAHQTSRKPREH